ncbi:MAG TPA: tRNA (adenosine(37)-N6)-threonylcarbamoyltransferase complex ATPase subunit type 1 TsaE [Oligoflexia bacterium]|nr:tRNA (adenosine(37)-N6)-threonylcarbamoyltransferase complex ATPase subunit type 1 TsaE [Oligoflexia bacterium]HMP48608.1 tRNA (adenosine(37)-N6)-threonylcarbamoyltransferase complex ATPase subunit type 1 TsaE [Oligoflexia bacterium]
MKDDSPILRFKESELGAFSAELVRGLPGRSIIGLSGPLGVGKTAMVRAIAKLFDLDKEVSSPSYVLENRYERTSNNYESSVLIRHWDLYRLVGLSSYPEDIIVFSDDHEIELVIIEWPEVFSDLLPILSVRIDMAFDPLMEDSRIIQIVGNESI